MIDEETVEDYIRRLAKQRYEMRMHFKWKLEENADDDWQWAKEAVEREIHLHPTRFEKDSRGDEVVSA